MKTENIKKLTGMIGLAARARKLLIGTDIACDGVRFGKACLLLCSYDASTNTKKRVFNCAKYYEVVCYEIPVSINDLGHYIGKEGAIAAIAVTDRNMAKGITNLLDEINTEMSEAVSQPREV